MSDALKIMELCAEVAQLGFEPGAAPVPKPQLLLQLHTAWKAPHEVLGLFLHQTDATGGFELGA